MPDKEWVVTPETIIEAYRYDEDEKPFVEILLQGAEGILEGAGAWKPNHKLTPTVISLIVGFWLENREGMTNDNRTFETLPFSITAMINLLRFGGGADETSQG